MEMFDDDVIIVVDLGMFCFYFSVYYCWCKLGCYFIINCVYGVFGYVLVVLMGVYIGWLGVKIVCVMGDGSFGFVCGEFEIMVCYWMLIILIVFFNVIYGWIKVGQNLGFGKWFYNVDFNCIDYVVVVSVFGVKSWWVEDLVDLKKVLVEVVNYDGLILVDVFF